MKEGLAEGIMTKDTELELKLQVREEACWGTLLADGFLQQMAVAPDWQRDRLQAVYYDTADGSLRKKRLTYRIRQEEGQWVATVKGGGNVAGGLHQRQEWNVPVDGPAVDFAVFNNSPAGVLLREAAGDAPLVPLCSTVFERHTLYIERPGHTGIEVAADRGEIVAGGKRAPILELELELKNGQPAELLRLGAELVRRYPLVLESSSKYHRALLLAGLAEAPPVLSPGQRTESLLSNLQALLDDCAGHPLTTRGSLQAEVAALLDLWAKLLEAGEK